MQIALYLHSRYFQNGKKRVILSTTKRTFWWIYKSHHLIKCLNNFKWICPSQRNTKAVVPLFSGLLAVFQKFLKRENVLLLYGKQLLVSFITHVFEEKRERELCRHLTFLYSLTIEALKAFHLWSSCGKKSGSLDSLHLPVQYIYIPAPIKAGQYAIPMYFLLWALPPHYNFHRHFVCKFSNRHIYHIKRDSIFFSIIHRYE